MRTVSVKIEFAAGHRILGLAGPGAKCRNVHGHNYTAWILFKQPDGFPPKVEFGDVKKQVKDWISESVDHGFFVHSADDFLNYLRVNDLKHFIVGEPPTTEAIAQLIGEKVQGLWPELKVVAVKLSEGPNNEGTWIADEIKPFNLSGITAFNNNTLGSTR